MCATRLLNLHLILLVLFIEHAPVCIPLLSETAG
jgi:hypothetical protein